MAASATMKWTIIAWGCFVSLALVGGVANPAVAEQVTCTLPAAADGKYQGTCNIPCSVNALAIEFDGINPKRACSGPARSVQASLAPAKDDAWLGRMDGKEPEDPVRFEVTPGKNGRSAVGKLPFGWFAIVASQRTPEAWAITLDASRQVPPSADDVRILARAKALLATVEIWNREDTRQCPPGQTKISLFCALQNATTEVSGGVHYRQPALQAAREVLNEVGVGRFKLHRIMDYNNHPDTTLAEVHALLDKARARIEPKVK
jgi:hypothetical protein